METSAEFLLTIGGILLLGLLTSTVARRSFLPRVTLLLIFGVLIGEEVFDLVPSLFVDHFDLIADMTLIMVGFLLGGKLTKEALRDFADQVIWISLTAALVTTTVVAVSLILFGVAMEMAIILGCIASATAPAAVLDVVNEHGGQSKFSKVLLSIVALDDVWALVIFSIGMAIVSSLNGVGEDTFFLWQALKEIVGALLLGVVIGYPAAMLTGRVKRGQPILSEALGIVFVCGGLAIWLEVSFLIAAMVVGAVVANVAKHHEYPFHEIANLESPVLVIFFVVAGASLELGALQDIGLIGIVYIICRVIGKYLGAHVGAHLSHADDVTKNWMGLALLPQAGVAIGMALVASNQFPEYRQVLLSIVISSTVFFEIIGPIFTKRAIVRAQQVNGD